MPATFAHPAFAWPFRALGLPLSSLVVGAMVPDIAHLLPRRPWTDHTALSVLTFSLPLGLVVFILYARGVAPSLAAIAPGPWRDPLERRASALARVPLRGPAVFGVLLGAASHVGIDACTHADGAVVRLWPEVFRGALVRTGWGPLPLHGALQYGGGLLGSIFLARALLRWARRTQTRPARPRDFAGLAAVLGLVLVVSCVHAHRESFWLDAPVRYHVFLVQGATAALVSSAVLAVALAALSSAWRRLRRGSGASEDAHGASS